MLQREIIDQTNFIKEFKLILIAEEKRWVQSEDNCVEIAIFLARKEGYNPPSSRKEIIEEIRRVKSIMLWEKKKYEEIIKKAKAFFMVYTPDSFQFFGQKAHITFKGEKEWNFGTSEFELDVRIPLK